MSVTREEMVRRLNTLTNREVQVLVLWWAGLTGKETGELLKISHRTVEVHRHAVVIALGMSPVKALWVCGKLNLMDHIRSFEEFVERDETIKLEI